MTCKVSMDDAINADNLSNDDAINSDIEYLAEKIMLRVELEVATIICESEYTEFTRADLNSACSSDKFNDVFYEMAERIIKEG